jgi:hypothetical protein
MGLNEATEGSYLLVYSPVAVVENTPEMTDSEKVTGSWVCGSGGVLKFSASAVQARSCEVVVGPKTAIIHGLLHLEQYNVSSDLKLYVAGEFTVYKMRECLATQYPDFLT